MSMMSLRLPKSMYGDLKEVAKVEGVSMNQFVTIAVAEKIASLNALD
ncbi:MAG: toxin-antitoxin system HicB family antitoxin, partial [Deltaproteobacteria bacterium]|nr:toxin-antitoxin system HicB family antitoxin [Deltaproteobacteria bacterium]